MSLDLHFGPDGTLQETAPLDHFAFFGLPRALKLDEAALEHDFFALSRRFHPDFFVTKPAEQQILSLDKTAALNNAYRVLRDRITRAEYLIELETGVAFGESGEAKQVPTKLLADVMEIREHLMDFQMAEEDESAELKAALEQDKIWAHQKQADVDSLIQRIADNWDTWSNYGPERRDSLVARLKDELSQRRYFTGLIRDIEKIL